MARIGLAGKDRNGEEWRVEEWTEVVWIGMARQVRAGKDGTG